MVVVGADVHKRKHTFVALDELGRKLGEKTVQATSAGHITALMWAREQFGTDLIWGIEDCRNMSARLERDLLSAGQQVLRVPTKLMAQVRKSARTRGKSDPSTLKRWRGRCCANPTCPSPLMMRYRGS
jgi:transposase